MTLRLPIITDEHWYTPGQYKRSFQSRHLGTQKKSSSNSPYTGQDLNASGSYSSCQQQHGQAEAASNSGNKYCHQPADGCRSLERKLEREREKRTHGEPLSSRLEPKVLDESSPPMTDLRQNGFHLASNATATRVTDKGGNSGPYRTTFKREALAGMGSLTVASTPSSAALRGHSIGFGSREASVTKSPTQGSKTFRSGLVTPLNDKRNFRYPFVDPVHSASPSFQQRLSELAVLESDTIRYERTKRIKKRSKQENQ